MEFLYSIINFLILAAILFFFGRKLITSIFRTRREKINRELDEAERIESEVLTLPQLDTDGIPTSDVLSRARLDKIGTERDERIAQCEKATDNQCFELRRQMLSDVREQTVKRIKERSAELFSAEPYVSMLRSREADMANEILSHVRLTPGDIAYLKTHDVLYVTLTSAFVLPEEIVREIGDFTDRMLEEVNGKTSYWVKQDSSLIGGIRLRIGDTIYDCTVQEELYHFERRTQREYLSGNETAEEIVKELEDEISRISSEVHMYQLGRVISVSDGICWMDGLADIMYGEVVEFDCGERGMVLDIQPSKIGCVIYGKYENIESGSRVRRVGRIASVPVGEMLLGRVVDALGHAIDGKGLIRATERRPIECMAPSIPDRAPVSKPMHTGIKAIDALVPIGRGQRELIIGDRQTGKSAIAIDTIINQKGKGVICIYVAIGQKETTVADIHAKLEARGAMDYTTIVCATASASASLQYVAPFAGCAMAEYFMYSGHDVLIVYDDLSKHAVAYRELSLLLHRPSGREAYPGDIFYLHSRLLERSASLSEEMGGGTMTALPLIETQAGDISSYIPTNVISITDGQIFLDNELFYEGQRPAVNVGLSVSRVGSAAQTKLMKQVSSSLRMNLAQYRELAGFSQFGSEVDEGTQKILDSGIRMMTVLKQKRYAPLPDWKQALIIYAVSEGFASDVGVDELEAFENTLYGYFTSQHGNIVKQLETGSKMDDSFKQEINGVLGKFAEVKQWQDSNR